MILHVHVLGLLSKDEDIQQYKYGIILDRSARRIGKVMLDGHVSVYLKTRNLKNGFAPQPLLA